MYQKLDIQDNFYARVKKLEEYAKELEVKILIDSEESTKIINKECKIFGEGKIIVHAKLPKNENLIKTLELGLWK